MTQQVEKVHTIHLTSSLRAGTKALEELCSQGHISSANWFNLQVSLITDEPPCSSLTRTLVFTLERGSKVEVKVMSWRGVIKQSPESRKWFPCHVYVQKGNRMEAYENHVNQEGYLWSRQPSRDKPIGE